jgi:type I restriction enzyme S subunit
MRLGYKQTDVGVIPEDWRYLAITKVARLESGHTPSKRHSSYWGGDINWISLFDTQGLSRNKIFTTEKTITDEGLNNSSARLLPAGTVVFSRTATVGKTSVMASSMATSQDFANYICGPELHNVFLVYLFRSMGRVWKALMAGSIHNTIYMPTFKALKILVPPVFEQKAIAEALSDIDELIESLEQLLTKKRQIKLGVMQELLTGRRRLLGFSGSWKCISMGELFSFGGGFTASRNQLSTDGYCYLHYGDIHMSDRVYINVREEFQNIPKLNVPLRKINQRALLDDGDVVFVDASEDYEGISKYVVVSNPDKVSFISGLHTIVAKSKKNSMDDLYKRYCFQTSSVKEQFRFFAVGTKVSGISKSNIAKVLIQTPPLAEQAAIASVLASMDDEIYRVEDQIRKTCQLKQGMMQELLTGRIRLV